MPKKTTTTNHKHTQQNRTVHKEKVRVGSFLNELIVIKDETGTILHKILKPTMVEFYPRDIIQVIVGATVLAIPLSYTEEVWRMGETIERWQALGIAGISMLFMGSFIFYTYYRSEFKEHWAEFIKRTCTTYLAALCVASIVLFLIGQTYPIADLSITLKRIILVAFPASMSAAITDTIK